MSQSLPGVVAVVSSSTKALACACSRHNYSRFRQLPWRGEKEAIRHLAAHDQIHKVALYERLAAPTLALLGGLWPDDATAVQLQADAGLGAIERALAFWDALLGDPPEGWDAKTN